MLAKQYVLTYTTTESHVRPWPSMTFCDAQMDTNRIFTSSPADLECMTNCFTSGSHYRGNTKLGVFEIPAGSDLQALVYIMQWTVLSLKQPRMLSQFQSTDMLLRTRWIPDCSHPLHAMRRATARWPWLTCWGQAGRVSASCRAAGSCSGRTQAWPAWHRWSQLTRMHMPCRIPWTGACSELPRSIT